MDSESLRTASEYLNNLLLARGLLRDGQPVDFVRPSKESRAQIINLVHDLVLRNDRDKEARETAAYSYRQLRAQEDQKTHEIERLHLKHEEAVRATVQAQTGERVAKESFKKIEKSLKTLQEQYNKLKAGLTQVKTQCTNDMRKRDLELARLKSHLQGQQRGNKNTLVAPSISISGDRSRPAFNSSVRDVKDPGYSLTQETNEFLTQLSSSLSDENDRLIGMVRNAVSMLNEQLGLQNGMKGAADSGIGDEANPRQRDKVLQVTPTNVDALTSELDFAMDHLKALLSNPTFVSIEEVEVREEEIVKMRSDWEKMELRWRGLLSMMRGWQKRMDTGGNINIEDLRKGMGLVSPGHGSKTSFSTSEPEENSLVDDSIDDLRNGVANEPKDVQNGSRHTRNSYNSLAGRASRIPKAQSMQPGQPVYENGRTSPKRKRDPLEPPETFDLRPRTSTKPVVSLASQRLEELDDDDSEELEIPRMTIEEKLTAVAEEAAAVRESVYGTTRSRAHELSLDGSADDGSQDGDTLGKLASANKRARIRGRPKRRKSTLSRDEFAELLIDI